MGYSNYVQRQCLLLCVNQTILLNVSAKKLARKCVFQVAWSDVCVCMHSTNEAVCAVR